MGSNQSVGELGAAPKSMAQDNKEAAKNVNVTISYCDSWGYDQKMLQLKETIEKAYPGIKVEGKVGDKSQFLVTVNGKVIHDKVNNGDGHVNTKEKLQKILDACYSALSEKK